jgi:hypothetical protein
MAKKIVFLALCCLFLETNAQPDIKISMQQTQISGIPPIQKNSSWEGHLSTNTKTSRTLWYIAGGAYVAAVAYALHARYLLNNLCAWNNWNNTIPLSDLASMPQKNVYVMLTKSIEIKYNCPPGPLTMNLTQFLQDTTMEIETLGNYKTFAQALNSCYIAPLFFISQDSIKQAEEKIKRLRFMQSVLANELEPTNAVRRLNIINYARQKYQSWTQRVLNRHH